MISTEDWKTGRAKVIIATSSFGVGVDYDRVRVVINYGIPYEQIDIDAWREYGAVQEGTR